MSTPDVRVRLSPEGIKEVIFGLREVQKEALKANRASAEGIGVVSTAVKDLKSLLPTLGLAAVVAGFAALSKQALNTADQTGKLQQKVGGTVEDISGLTLAFRTNESNQEGLQTALQKTANVIGAVQAQSTETIAALEGIGVNTKALSSLSTPRALEEIAKQLQKFPPGAERAAAAQKIFGKSSQELLVALDAVGEQGIDKFKEKAKQLGVLIDDDLAGAAARANDALGIIRIQAEGLATQFVSGLAPAVADAMETFSTAVTGDGTNGMELFGKTIGFVIRAAVALFVGFGKVIGAQIARVATFIESVVDASKALASGDFSGALEALQEGARKRAAILTELKSDLAGIGRDLFEGPKPNAPRKAGGTGGAPDLSDENAKKAAAAQSAALKQALQDELKLQQEAIKSQEAANKASYDQNLISLQEYFDKRRELAQRGAAAETAALKAERQRAAADLATTIADPTKTEADRLKARQAVATLTAQIQAKEIEGARELADINSDQAAAQKDLGQQQLDLVAKLATAEGDRHAGFLRNLQVEIQQIRDLGVRAGQSVAETQAQVDRLTNARTSQFDFEEATRKGEQALQAFTRDAEQIRRDQEAGIITQIGGEMRLIELQGQRIEVLRQLADAATAAAAATNDPDQIAKAQQFAASIDQIAASYRSATDVASKFKEGGVEAFQSGIESLLANAQNIESIGDAFKSLARGIASALQQIAAEILAKQAVFALLRAFGGVSIPATGAKTGGYVRGYAGGGDIAGKQLPIRGPDKIPILAQKGEFMMRKSRVQEPGALDFLRRWNSGQFSLAQMMSVPRFAEGGEIGASAAGGSGPVGGAQGGNDRPIFLRNVNVLSPDLVNDALASPQGEQTFLNAIERNATSIKRMLG